MSLTVKGMRDLLDQDYLKFEYIIENSKKILKKYGFLGIETPILEYTSIFQKSLGETSDIIGKEMFSFLDKNENSLTLRPEGTAAIARALASKKINFSKKLFYVGPFFRYERPQKGRYRQFTQLSVEWVFTKSPLSDVEVINCAIDVLNNIGIDFNLHLSTLGDFESREKFKSELVNYLKHYENDLSEDSKKRLYKNPLRILDSKNESDKKICENAPKLVNFLNDKSKKHFETIVSYMNQKNLIIDDNLVRGLDYYNHTIFEFKSQTLGAQDTILAGGRYDGLVGNNSPSIGWSMGVDRAMLIFDEVYKKDSIGILYISDEEIDYCLFLAKNLRDKDYIVNISYQESVRKRMKELDQLECKLVLIIGSDEIKQKTIKIKNLYTNNETIIGLNNISDYLDAIIK